MQIQSAITSNVPNDPNTIWFGNCNHFLTGGLAGTPVAVTRIPLKCHKLLLVRRNHLKLPESMSNIVFEVLCVFIQMYRHTLGFVFLSPEKPGDQDERRSFCAGHGRHSRFCRRKYVNMTPLYTVREQRETIVAK